MAMRLRDLRFLCWPVASYCRDPRLIWRPVAIGSRDTRLLKRPMAIRCNGRRFLRRPMAIRRHDSPECRADVALIDEREYRYHGQQHGPRGWRVRRQSSDVAVAAGWRCKDG